MGTFEEFVAASPVYGEMYSRLEAAERKLAFSASAVYEVHGEALARIAEPLLGYARRRFGADAAERYAERCRELEALQERFDRDRRVETLGAPDRQVAPDEYHLALLLSIVFTNHRFEILQQLEKFLAALGPQGALAALGIGTGYELKLAAEILPRWELEGYDIDSTAESEARGILRHFGIAREIRFGAEFPIGAPDAARKGRYDAIVACEVLEHLADPAQALRTMREYLASADAASGRPAGRMFVTMAVNMAQEDHIYLYPDLDSCRGQVRDCGFGIVEEWITPQTLWPPPANREKKFKRGNYVAVLSAV